MTKKILTEAGTPVETLKEENVLQVYGVGFTYRAQQEHGMSILARSEQEAKEGVEAFATGNGLEDVIVVKVENLTEQAEAKKKETLN